MADLPHNPYPVDNQDSKPARPKGTRTSSSLVRARNASPTPGESSEPRPPQKRARKAINCEPCRNSKLKCDRNRPCSSCVLRGTVASCYQDGGPDPERVRRPNDVSAGTSAIDPLQEIFRMKQSLALLESSVLSSYGKPFAMGSPNLTRRLPDTSMPEREEAVAAPFHLEPNSLNMPGMLAPQERGGIFLGMTSINSHLLSGGLSAKSDEDGGPLDDFLPEQPEYDRDLIDKLPNPAMADALFDHYFRYCTWIYRHVNEPAFRNAWQLFVSSAGYSRLMLATAFVIMAVALQYLPSKHPLIDNLSASREGTAQMFYATAKRALARYMEDSRVFTLELLELMLIRTHYLTFIKTETEEIWHVTGELVTMGKAMGLHRDPAKWTMSRELAERRRWAWWHIILLERWQSFLFGRPISIASHHYDTELPSYCDPNIDPTGRRFLPNLALFRLAHILGDVVDKALSVGPISFDSVRTNDHALLDWYQELPEELALDDFRTARSLSSEDLDKQRFGVQSVIIRTSYYHIRFTLHRPYASVAHSTSNHSGKAVIADPVKAAQSLEIAVTSAEKLINMASQATPDVSHTSLPGHMNWGGFHSFSAAMFFSFQLLANPDQPGATLFKESIRKAMHTLEQYRGSDVADKGYEILHVLSPLYTNNFENNPEAREQAKSHVLKTVRKLEFPYQDTQVTRRRRAETASPHSGQSYHDSPARSVGPSASPGPAGGTHNKPQFEAFPGHHLVSSMRTTSNSGGRTGSAYNSNDAQRESAPNVSPMASHSGTHVVNGNSHSPNSRNSLNGHLQAGGAPGPMAPPPPPYLPQPSQQGYEQGPGRFGYGSSEWGASSGLEQGEWSQLMTVLQPHRQGPGFTSQLP